MDYKRLWALARDLVTNLFNRGSLVDEIERKCNGVPNIEQVAALQAYERRIRDLLNEMVGVQAGF